MTWFQKWAADYATSFGLNDEEVKIIGKWESAFVASGATEEALRAITASLLTDASPLAPNATLGKMANHLSTIQTMIRRKLAVSLDRAREKVEKDYGICVLCDGSGMVIVPHIEGVRNGAWLPLKTGRGDGVYYTQAVWCSCRLGQWKEGRWRPTREFGPGDKRPMNFKDYEEINPRWQVQREKRRNDLRENAALVPVSERWAACIDRLLEIQESKR